MKKNYFFKLFQNTEQVLTRLLFFLTCFFLILFPVLNFKINFQSAIFPAFEIIFIYYFMSFYSVKFWVLFATGLFCDQLYSMPIGTNSLIFLTSYWLLKSIAQFFLTNDYLINFLIFCCYCFLVLNARYFLVNGQTLNLSIYITMIFQCLNTIFSYSLVRILLDNPLEYFQKNAK